MLILESEFLVPWISFGFVLQGPTRIIDRHQMNEENVLTTRRNHALAIYHGSIIVESEKYPAIIALDPTRWIR
jgi:hypothetical protein